MVRHMSTCTRAIAPAFAASARLMRISTLFLQLPMTHGRYTSCKHLFRQQPLSDFLRLVEVLSELTCGYAVEYVERVQRSGGRTR